MADSFSLLIMDLLLFSSNIRSCPLIVEVILSLKMNLNALWGLFRKSFVTKKKRTVFNEPNQKGGPPLTLFSLKVPIDP